MNCGNCGNLVPVGATRCANCGTIVPPTSPTPSASAPTAPAAPPATLVPVPAPAATPTVPTTPAGGGGLAGRPPRPARPGDHPCAGCGRMITGTWTHCRRCAPAAAPTPAVTPPAAAPTPVVVPPVVPAPAPVVPVPVVVAPAAPAPVVAAPAAAPATPAAPAVVVAPAPAVVPAAHAPAPHPAPAHAAPAAPAPAAGHGGHAPAAPAAPGHVVAAVAAHPTVRTFGGRMTALGVALLTGFAYLVVTFVVVWAVFGVAGPMVRGIVNQWKPTAYLVARYDRLSEQIGDAIREVRADTHVFAKRPVAGEIREVKHDTVFVSCNSADVCTSSPLPRKTRVMVISFDPTLPAAYTGMVEPMREAMRPVYPNGGHAPFFWNGPLGYVPDRAFREGAGVRDEG